MKFFVPYDGSRLAVAALERAQQLCGESDVDVVVATVVPNDRDYAIEQGWMSEDEAFDADSIETTLREQVRDIAPDAEFRCLKSHSYASAGSIATRLRDIATEMDADAVFLGSENVGSIAAPVSSIGSNVATRVPYDIYLVQNP